jgi:hypothetical protein
MTLQGSWEIASAQLFVDLSPNKLGERDWHCVSDLADQRFPSAYELVLVWKGLQPRALTNGEVADHTIR